MKQKAELAYVLCAGEGARLHPLTEFIPKPLLPLLDRPMVFHVFDALRAAGIRRFLVNLHHRAADMERALSEYADINAVSIRFAREARLLGTGGALRNTRELLAEPFFLVNSDFLPAGFSFADMERAHAGLATLAVAPMPPGAGFNPAGVDQAGRIVRVGNYFGEGGEDHRFLGVHRIEPEALRQLCDREVFPLFTGFYDRSFASGQAIWAYRCDGVFAGDLGTLAGYRAAHEFLLRDSGREEWIGGGVSGLDHASIEAGSVLGDGVCLGDGARIERAIVFPAVSIPAGALIRSAIVGSSPPGDVVDKVYIHSRETPLS